MSADLANVDEIIAHVIPYQGDPAQPTDVWLAPVSSPIAGDLIVSDADWQTILSWQVSAGESYRSADYTRSDPGQWFRCWQLNVDADPSDALAIAIGIAVDSNSTPAPTPMSWLDSRYDPLCPTRTMIPGAQNASVDLIDGICVPGGTSSGGSCDGWMPREWVYGQLTPPTHPPLPNGTIGADGNPVDGSTPEPTGPPAPELISHVEATVRVRTEE
jgi:hypothetical protein